MKLLSIFSTIAFLILSLFTVNQSAAKTVDPQDTISPSPSPTYDPLLEPVLPENPTELELGHFWFWHNCMTCHGDVGQGLTDEFRGVWPEDHQNCWAHGCHNGTQDGGGFPIPRFVPPLVGQDKLAKFSQQGLFDYLKSTHPPQTPGVLEDDQYQAIIKYLFELNDRQFVDLAPAPTQTTIPTATIVPNTPTPDQVPVSDASRFPVGMIVAGVLVIGILIWIFRSTKPRE